LWLSLQNGDDHDVISFFDVDVVRALLDAVLDPSAQSEIMGCLQALSHIHDGRLAIMSSQAVKVLLPHAYAMEPSVMGLFSIMLTQLFQSGHCFDILCSREGCHSLLFMAHRLVVEASHLFCCCVAEFHKAHNPAAIFDILDADNLATLIRLLSCGDVMVSALTTPPPVVLFVSTCLLPYSLWKLQGAKICRHCNHDVVSEPFVPERVSPDIAVDVQTTYEASPVGSPAHAPGYCHRSKTAHFQLCRIQICSP
jgi:hypothetical protein